MSSFIRLIKRLLGFPTPDPEFPEEYITMRESRDCAVAAVATAVNCSYDEARRALWHWDLPFFLESPILSNPWNVMRALRNLGAEPRRVDSLDGCVAGQTILLVHDPRNWFYGFIGQHWVVWFGQMPDGRHMVHWGQKQTFRVVSDADLQAMLNSSWPHYIIKLEGRARGRLQVPPGS